MPDPTPKPLPSQAFLRSVLDYNPTTGVFIWRWRKDCTSQRNGKHAGKIAGSLGAREYMVIRLNGMLYRSHRLAWMWMYGVDPGEQIDHKNLIKSDNWIENLRPAKHGQNQQNTTVISGKTLPKGVTENEDGRFRARITVDGKSQYLGAFRTPGEAAAAYRDAATELFGEFARAA